MMDRRRLSGAHSDKFIVNDGTLSSNAAVLSPQLLQKISYCRNMSVGPRKYWNG